MNDINAIEPVNHPMKDPVPPAMVPDQEPAQEKVSRKSNLIIPQVKRLDWIDGMRGIAEMVIFVHHFGDNTFGELHPEILPWGSPQIWARNGQFAVDVFFILSARVLTYSFLKSRNSENPKWTSLISTIFRRTIRLAVPVYATILIQFLACQTNSFTQIEKARYYLLSNTYFYPPQWCQINTLRATWNFLLQVFTSNQFLVNVNLGSSLWSMYAQFWGSVYVYALTIMCARMGNARFLVYLVAFLGTFFTNNINMVFLVGLVFSDLDASGYTKRFRSLPSYIVLTVQTLTAALMLYLMFEPEVNQQIDESVASWTVRDGKLRSDPNTWPVLMQGTNTIMGICLFIFVELSDGIQHLFEFRILVFFGKITFGMYLLQMAFIYTMMPGIVLWLTSFNTLNYAQVNYLTFFLLLAITAFFSWIWTKTIDEFALHNSHRIWQWFTKAPRVSFVAQLRYSLLFIYENLRATPAATVNYLQDLYERTMKQISAYPREIHQNVHWRDIAPRSTSDVENSGAFSSQATTTSDTLHSTQFDAVLAKDEGSTSTRRILYYYGHSFLIHLFVMLGLWAFFFIYNPMGFTMQFAAFNIIYQCLWLLLVPHSFFWYFGFCTPKFVPVNGTARRPVVRNQLNRLFMVLTTNGIHEKTVRQSFAKLEQIAKLHPSIQLVVLTDEEAPSHFSDLNSVVVPASFESKSNYKARALEYFRQVTRLSTDDWVLHLDEDSVIDSETLRGCFNFIRYEKHDLGQGIIAFNSVNYWKNWLITVADARRVGDQLSRYHLQYTIVQRPVFGMSGSFFLASASVLNTVTWENNRGFLPMYEFSHLAWEKGFTCGPIHGICQEQSTSSLYEFIEQRRKWYAGMSQIQKSVYNICHRSLKAWTNMILVLTVLIVNFPLTVYADSSSSVFWIAFPSTFAFAVFVWTYIVGVLFQDIHAKRPVWEIVFHVLATLVLIPFTWFLEVYSIIYALKYPPKELKIAKKD